MRPIVSVSVALALACLPAAAIAQVTQTYQYDANGRLTGVITTGSGGTNAAAYVYDDANNRTSRTQTGTTAYAALLQLQIDEALKPDQALVSPHGRFTLALRASGRLELWWGNEPVSASLDSTSAAFRLGEDGRAWFIQPADPSSHPGITLALTNDGSLFLFEEIGSAAQEASQAEGEGQ